MEHLEEFPWCCPFLLLELPFPGGDIPDTFVDVVSEDHSHSGDLQLAFDELCVPCLKLRLVHHNVQGNGTQWKVASADSASTFCFSEIG